MNTPTWSVYNRDGDLCACGLQSRRDAERWFPPSMEGEYKVLQDGAKLEHKPA